MTDPQRRIEALRSVRRRDRAQAFNALKQAFEKVETINIELEEVKQRRESLQAEITTTSTLGVVSARQGTMDSLNRSRISKELNSLKLVEKQLIIQAVDAKISLDSARDAATRAQGVDHNKR